MLPQKAPSRTTFFSWLHAGYVGCASCLALSAAVLLCQKLSCRILMHTFAVAEIWLWFADKGKLNLYWRLSIIAV
jgi:hypothetical protein